MCVFVCVCETGQCLLLRSQEITAIKHVVQQGHEKLIRRDDTNDIKGKLRAVSSFCTFITQSPVILLMLQLDMAGGPFI